MILWDWVSIVTKKIGQYKIPFDSRGDLMSYDGFGVFEWRDNYSFVDTLKLEGSGRGRSSVTFKFRSLESGVVYSMFISDATYLFQNCVVRKGVVRGSFTFVKKGSNYGLTLIAPIDGDENEKGT